MFFRSALSLSLIWTLKFFGYLVAFRFISHIWSSWFPKSSDLIIPLSCSTLFRDSPLPQEWGTNFNMNPTFLCCLLSHHPLQMFNPLVQRLEISALCIDTSSPLPVADINNWSQHFFLLCPVMVSESFQPVPINQSWDSWWTLFGHPSSGHLVRKKSTRI